jgi:hypothetical protein
MGYFWLELTLELDQLEGPFDRHRSAGIEMFRAAFAMWSSKYRKKIIRAEKRYN